MPVTGSPALSAPIAKRFFVLLGLGVVASCAGYAALVLQTTSGPAAVALRNTYPYDWAARPYTLAEYTSLRVGLWVVALGTLLLGSGLAAAAPGRRELAALGREVAGGGRGLWRGWRALRPVQRRWAGAALLLLTLLRGYYGWAVQPYDDATSYELFVRESLLTVSAVYGLPNNHVLSNTLAWGFYQLYPGFWWAMRLPVLLTSTLVTSYWFLALLRRSSFGVALRAVGWFSLLSLSLYYAATGRGYWLLVGLGGVSFFALLELETLGPARQRAAWVAFVGSGILGLYTVPTHALFLVSAYAWLGLRASRRRAGPRLLLLAVLGSLTGLGTALLYAPLLLLSGTKLLLYNDYVRTLPAAEFWRAVPEALLVPHHLLNLPVVLLLLGGAWHLRQRARAGRLPARWQAIVRQLTGVSGWFFVFPYGLAAVLRQLPPERTLFYKSQYLFILAALLAEWGIQKARTPQARRYMRWGLVAGTLLFAGGQLWQLQRQELLWQRSWRWQLGGPAVDWLARQPVAPVLASGPYVGLVLRFYAHRAHRNRPWHIDTEPRPGIRYGYLVRPAGGGAPVERPVFQNELLAIFPVP